MKKIIYLKVSNKTNKIRASYLKDYKPLTKDYGKTDKEKYYPTITLKLNVEIPDNFFTEADKEISLKLENLNICSEIKVEEVRE